MLINHFLQFDNDSCHWKAQKEGNRLKAEVHRSKNSIELQNISLEKSKTCFKTTEEATRNIQNGLKEVKGLHGTAEVNV